MVQRYSGFMQWTSRLVIVCLLAAGLPMQSAIAGIVGTDQIVNQDISRSDRAKIVAYLDRADVLAQMQQRGVSVGEAKNRVNALTDEEAHRLAGNLDSLPAGGDVLGLLFTVFIVLLITDILGFTKVFPFTRAIKR